MDYAVKRVKGAQYDVVYEDSGMNEVHVIDPNTLLEIGYEYVSTQYSVATTSCFNVFFFFHLFFFQFLSCHIFSCTIRLTFMSCV